MTNDSDFHVVPHGNVIEIQLSDHLLLDTLAQFDVPEAVEKEVQLRQPTRVVFSLKNVTSCTTTLVNCLLTIQKQLTQQRRKMAICEVPTVTLRTLQELNLADVVFEIYTSLAKSLESDAI